MQPDPPTTVANDRRHVGRRGWSLVSNPLAARSLDRHGSELLGLGLFQGLLFSPLLGLGLFQGLL